MVFTPKRYNCFYLSKLRKARKKYPFPKTRFEVNLKVNDEGAMFDIAKKDEVAFLNFCCFEAIRSKGLLENVEELSRLKKIENIQQPQLSNWIYTIPINPFVLPDEEIQIAGEVELYIYYAIYLGKKKH